jgi:hypothetical protein
MRWLSQVRFLVFFAALFVSTNVFAQSPIVDSVPLPISPTPERLESLTYLTPGPLVSPVQTPAHHQRTSPLPLALTQQQMEYRKAVRALGKDDHHFVHVELTNGKMRTGAIIGIDDTGFQLRDGIVRSNHIAYSELSAEPYHVPAVGTHIANGFKWAGFGTGIGVVFVLAIPAMIVLIPLMASGVIQD